MDKRKEKTLKEVRKKIGIQIQDRRNLLKNLLSIEDIEQTIKLTENHLVDMKAQKLSGTTERDQFGNIVTKRELDRKITMFEFQLKKLKVNLDILKEDLYLGLTTNEGLLDKAGSLIKLKENINSHYDLMRREYEKTKEVIKYVI